VNKAAQSSSGVKTSVVVAKNTFWGVFEAVAALLVVFLTSIAIARTFGPTKLGYYNFVLWLTSMSASIGSLGVPAATGKYMGEYLGRGERGIARTIFFKTLGVQSILASILALVGLALVLTLLDPAYRLPSVILLLGMIPQMIAYVPSQANNAAEQINRNVHGSIAGMATYVIGVTLSLALGWDLLGVAVSTLLCHLIELAMKMWSVVDWVKAVPASPLPQELRTRMLGFSGQSSVLLLLNMVVWERSDVLFLKLLNHDIRQVAFFSVPFSLVERASMAPQVIANAIAVSVFAEYGRDKQRMVRMAEIAFKYVLALSVPILFGLASLSNGVISLLYGAQYAPAAGVLTVVAFLAVAKCVFLPIRTLHAAVDNLKPVLWVTCIGGAIDIVLDVALIPRFGALGAAIANGAAQVYASAWLWMKAPGNFNFRFERNLIFKVVLCGTVMAAVVAPQAWLFKPLTALVTGTLSGCLIYLVMVRTTGILASEDRLRLASGLPQFARLIPVDRLLSLLAPNTVEPVEDVSVCGRDLKR
jgi:O-antigen/teichoic acid export membrane protein